MTSWGTNLEQPVPKGQNFVEEMHKGAVNEELQPVGRTPRAVCGGLSLMGYSGLIVAWAVSSGTTTV